MAEKLTGEIRVLQQLNKYEFAFEADILRTGLVQGGKWEFRNLERNYLSFKGQPVLVAYTNFGNKVGDGHNSTDKVDPDTGEKYRSFTAPTAERIVGMISADDSDLTLIERENQLWLRVKGKIWAEYAHELVRHLMLTGSMSVSVEVIVNSGYEENGVEIYESWEGIGLTVLGSDVAPAVPTANIRALAAMREEFEEMKLRVASLVKEETEPKPTKPEKSMKGLKNRMNFSKKQLAELQAKFGAEYKVLCASADGDTTHVKLMRMSDCSFHSYDLGAKDSAILPEKFVARAAYIVMSDDNGENEVCAEAADVIGETCSAAESEKDVACAENKKLSDELAAAKAKIAEMESFESNRRKNAAAEHAKTILGKYNLNRQEKVSESVISNVVSCAQNGDYNDRMDKDGNWVGLADVEKDVLAMCASEQMKLDAKNVQASKTEFCWEGLSRERGNRDSGDIRSLIDSL